MITNPANIKLSVRNAKSNEFTSSNIILNIGEVAYETDSKRTKIGDGTTAWNSLKYTNNVLTTPVFDSDKTYIQFNATIGLNTLHLEAFTSTISISFNDPTIPIKVLPSGSQINFNSFYDRIIWITITYNFNGFKVDNLIGKEKYLQIIMGTNIVNELPNYSFWGAKNLHNVIFSPNITAIKVNCFSGCSSLTNITLPPSVNTLGVRAFDACTNLEILTIEHPTITPSLSMSGLAFQNCPNLIRITINDDNATISTTAFEGVTSIVIASNNVRTQFMKSGKILAIEPIQAVTEPGQIEPILATYLELEALVNNNELSIGQLYILTDYNTKYNLPYVGIIKEVSPGNVEELVLEANSSNSFKTICSSLLHPQDIVYYDFNNNICEDGTTQRNGFITRRHDTIYNVNLPNDWRYIVWPRFKATAPVWVTGNAVVRGQFFMRGSLLYVTIRNGIPSNDIDSLYFLSIGNVNDYIYSGEDVFIGLIYNTTTYALRYTFNADIRISLLTATDNYTFNNNSFNVHNINYNGNIDIKHINKGLCNIVHSYSDIDNKPYNNYAESSIYNIYFYQRNYSLNIGSNFNNNIINDNCNSTNFGKNNQKMIIGYNSYNCNFGINNENIFFSAGCNNNDFGTNVHSIYLSLNNKFIKISIGCYDLVIGSSSSNITYGIDCYNIILYNSATNIVFENAVYNLIFAMGFMNNVLIKTGTQGFTTSSSALTSRAFPSTVLINNTLAARYIYITTAVVVGVLTVTALTEMSDAIIDGFTNSLIEVTNNNKTATKSELLELFIEDIKTNVDAPEYVYNSVQDLYNNIFNDYFNSVSTEEFNNIINTNITKTNLKNILCGLNQ